MPRIPRRPLVRLLTLAGLVLLFIRLQTPAPWLPQARLLPAPPHTPAEAALREAWRYQTRAQLSQNQERYGLEGWDPQVSLHLDPETWRLQILARDPTGDLRRARFWVRRAAALAHTPAEAFAAAELQVMLDHETGDHRADLQGARKPRRLAPGSTRARGVLQNAERCRERARAPQRGER